MNVKTGAQEVAKQKVTVRKQAEASLVRQNSVLEQIAAGERLEIVLEEIVAMVEGQLPGSLCSVVLLDASGKRMRLGAGKSLPVGYSRGLEGAEIGPTVGSCGTAAYHRKTVIVSDIATDPLWAEIRHLALPFELRSCWSVPIRVGMRSKGAYGEGRVLGTFALYYREPREPRAEDLRVVERAASLAGIAVERDEKERILLEREKALQETKDFLQQVVDVSPSMIYVSDSEGRTVFVNKYAADYYQTTPEKMMSRTTEESHPHAEEALSYVKENKEVLRTGQKRVREEPNTAPDGKVHWFHTVKVPLVRADGRVDLLGISTDITERKLAETALLDASQFNDEVVKSFQDGLLILDRELRYQLWNQRMEEMSGVPAREVLGKRAFDVFPFLREAGLERYYANVLAGGTVSTPDFIYHVPDTGRTGWSSQVMGPLRNAKGEVVGIIISVRDVTERKIREESLRLFRELVDRSTDGIEVIDPATGRYLDVNDRACDQLGYTREELLAMRVMDINPVATEAIFLAGVEEARKPGGRKLETVHRHKDGRVFPIELNLTCFQLEREYLVAVVRDITERRESEELLRGKQAELAHMSRVATAGELTTGIAHEINQPMAAALFYAETCRDLVSTRALDSQSLVAPLNNLISQIERARNTINRLRQFIRGRPLSDAPVEVNTLLRNSVQLISHELASANVTIRYKLDKGEPVIQADPIMMEQVIVNLLLNALQALADAGDRKREILLGTALGDDGVVTVCIRDNGPGLPASIREHLFQPFTTSKIGGLGMGLSISRSIIERHGGKIWHEEAPRGGAVFKFSVSAKKVK